LITLKVGFEVQANIMSSSSQPPDSTHDSADRPKRILVIGYGNDLRCDDAVGQRISELVSQWKLPNVFAIAVRQLTPELAEMLADVDLTIFVDVYPAQAGETDVRVQPIDRSKTTELMSHMGDPRSLLALTRALYGHAPQAWWVTVPGMNFGIKISLSPTAEQGVETALSQIQQLIQTARTEPCMKLE
jgi:hydrogenase maturation protease